MIEVRIGGRTVSARVLEDRGPLEPNGPHLVHLAANFGPGDEVTTFDLSVPEDDIPRR